MVLATAVGAAARRPHGSDDGSAALEVALSLPLVVLLLVALLHAAVLGADIVAAQGVAREAARVAAVADDRAVTEAAERAAGRRPVQVRLDPPTRSPGDVVTATVRLRSAAFAAFGAQIWIPARTAMRVEDG